MNSTLVDFHLNGKQMTFIIIYCLHVRMKLHYKPVVLQEEKKKQKCAVLLR